MEEVKTDQRQDKKEERSFELRSEKVRSIVGQIPSVLVRYGITAIGVVFICLFAVAYFLPYKRVYSGTATIHEIIIVPTDSTDITILLRFESKRPDNAIGQMLYLHTPDSSFAGQIQNLSSIRDTLARQETLCRFKTTDIQPLENQTVDFRLIQYSENFLQKIFGDIGL